MPKILKTLKMEKYEMFTLVPKESKYRCYKENHLYFCYFLTVYFGHSKLNFDTGFVIDHFDLTKDVVEKLETQTFDGDSCELLNNLITNEVIANLETHMVAWTKIKTEVKAIIGQSYLQSIHMERKDILNGNNPFKDIPIQYLHFAPASTTLTTLNQ
jgi:hypothetical protein